MTCNYLCFLYMIKNAPQSGAFNHAQLNQVFYLFMLYLPKFIQETELRMRRMNIFQGTGHHIFSQWRRKGHYDPLMGVKNRKVLLIGGFSPGHGLMLHMIISTAVPSHGRPPCWADGLLQVLVLVRLPRPQLLVHSSQGLHSDQLPCTAQR